MILERQQREMKKKAQQEKQLAAQSSPMLGKSQAVGSSPSVGGVILPASLLPRRSAMAAEQQTPPRAPPVAAIGAATTSQFVPPSRSVQQPPLQFLVGTSPLTARSTLILPSTNLAANVTAPMPAAPPLPYNPSTMNANGTSFQYAATSLQNPVDALVQQLKPAASNVAAAGHLPAIVGASLIPSGRLPTLQTLQQARLASGAQNSATLVTSSLSTTLTMPRAPTPGAVGPLLVTPSIQIQSSAPRPHNSNSIVVLAGSPINRLGTPLQIRASAVASDPNRVVKPVQALESVLQNQMGGASTGFISPSGAAAAPAPQSYVVTSNALVSPIRFTAAAQTRPTVLSLQLPASSAGTLSRFVAVPIPLRIMSSNSSAQVPATVTQVTLANSTISTFQPSGAIRHPILLANPTTAQQSQQLTNFLVFQPLNNQTQQQPRFQAVSFSTNVDGSRAVLPTAQPIIQLQSRPVVQQQQQWLPMPLQSVRVVSGPAMSLSDPTAVVTANNSILVSEKQQLVIANSNSTQDNQQITASMSNTDQHQQNNSILDAVSSDQQQEPAASIASSPAGSPQSSVGFLSKAITSGVPFASLPLISNASSVSQLRVYNLRDRLWTADGRAVRMSANNIDVLDERAPPETLAELNEHIARKQLSETK